MHLRKAAIRNYRSLENVDVQFGKITVVVGNSDVGKSNLVRALKDWACYTSAQDIATHGKETVRIAVAVGEQHKVVFEKRIKADGKGASSKNRYVTKDGETGQVHSYEKIGRAVPEEILQITGIRPVTIGEKGEADQLKLMVNFSDQGDNWFLVGPSWSAGQVSKVIGKVSGVEALVLANRDLVTQRMTCNREAKGLREKILEGEERLTEFDQLDHALALVEQAETLIGEIAKDEGVIGQAMDLLRTTRDHRLRKEAAEARAEQARVIVEADDRLGLVADLERLAEAHELLRVIESKTKQAEHHRALAEALSAAVDVYDEAKLGDDFNTQANVADLQRMIGGRETAAERFRSKAEEANERVDELAAKLEELADCDGLTCPLTGEPAPEECRDKLRHEGEVVRSQS